MDLGISHTEMALVIGPGRFAADILLLLSFAKS